MLQPLILQAKPMYCFRHKKQIVSHLCIETKCNNNPIICSQCINEGLNRNYHYDHHEKSILPVPEAVESLCETIKSQNNPIQRIYKSTLGRGDFNSIASQLEKGPALVQELDNRITTIKSQVELELQLLAKEFQKILLVEKQEYFRLLQNYQRTFIRNFEFLRDQTQPIVDFQNSIKYYSNKNNFYMKIASQINRKTDWIVRTKKTLQQTAKNIETTTFPAQLSQLLGAGNKIKLDFWPTWKGEDTIEKNNQLKFVIKRVINQWVFIPDLKLIEQELDMQPQSPGLKNYYVSPANGK